MLLQRSRNNRASPDTVAASKKLEVGIYLGHLPRPLPAVPTVGLLLRVLCCQRSRRAMQESHDRPLA